MTESPLRLLLVRHAIAVDRDAFPGPDSDRPLTDAGRDKMERAAAGLRRLLPAPGFLVSSLLVRAVETADVLATAWPSPPHRARWDELGFAHHPSRLVERLRRLEDSLPPGPPPLVVAVGHRPHLDQALALLVTGRAEPFHRFKKGGSALLEIDQPTPGGARLLWALAPKIERALARDDH